MKLIASYISGFATTMFIVTVLKYHGRTGSWISWLWS